MHINEWPNHQDGLRGQRTWIGTEKRPELTPNGGIKWATQPPPKQ